MESIHLKINEYIENQIPVTITYAFTQTLTLVIIFDVSFNLEGVLLWKIKNGKTIDYDYEITNQLISPIELTF